MELVFNIAVWLRISARCIQDLSRSCSGVMQDLMIVAIEPCVCIIRMFRRIVEEFAGCVQALIRS
jgi:hypothetical protein